MFVEIAQNITDAFLFLQAVATRLTGWVLPMVITGLTIQLMWHGFNILRGSSGSHAIFDVFAKLMRSFLIISLCLATNAYTDNVVAMRTDVENSLVSAATGTPGGNKYASLDTAAQQALNATDKIVQTVWGKISIWDLGGTIGDAIRFTIVAGIMYLCILIFCIISAIDYIVIDVSVLIILGLGPVFVACWAFEATSRFFDSWLNAVIKYTVTVAVINILVIASVTILSTLTSDIATGPLEYAPLVKAIAAACILALLVSKASALAGDIVGGTGISLNSSGAASKAVSAATGAPGKLMKMAQASRAAGGAAGKAGGAAGRGGSAGSSGGLSGKAANVVAGAAKGAATGGKAGAIKGAAQGGMK